MTATAVTPDLIRGPPFFTSGGIAKEGGCRIKSGMTKVGHAEP
jgi:hypothetical protein